MRIRLRLKIGPDLMAGTDDPLFFGLSGSAGREFRVKHAHGHSLRRGAEEEYVFGAPDDPETNVAHAELNDPTAPPLDVDAIRGAYLRKGFEPIPNVRGMGEMDDRIELMQVQVEVDAEGRPKPLRFERRGPIWLGLVSGLAVEIALVEG